MQDKYAKTGKFVVILSHMVNYNKKFVDGYLKKAKLKVTSFQSFQITKAPLSDEGVPHLILFDHNGKIVEQDWEIEGLDKKVEKLVKEASKK